MLQYLQYFLTFYKYIVRTLHMNVLFQFQHFLIWEDRKKYMIIIIKTSMKVVGELSHKNMTNNMLSSHYEKIIVAMVT